MMLQVLLGWGDGKYDKRLQARVEHAAKFAKTNHPLLITGKGRGINQKYSEAEVAKSELLNLGYNGEIWIDEQARTTVQSARILRQKIKCPNPGQIAYGTLFTDSTHMPRALDIFTDYIKNVTWTGDAAPYDATIVERIWEPLARGGNKVQQWTRDSKKQVYLPQSQLKR